MKKVSETEKWKMIISAILAIQPSIDQLYVDGKEFEAEVQESARIELLRKAYDISFKNNVRPQWFFDKYKDNL